ncbi:vesicle transport protein SFT2C [Denticeps clupeoides]|uniref:vesicle transport protein SFT2C n=1 Tax=Denticeps clupeoides TaxID=299321 RepID=UPI0010A3508F|nr:vesicle transport protein SFT2C-like [Denticeps clupeoides]
MAELNRQLQEYLSQSRSGTKPGPPSGPSTAVDVEDSPAVPGSWFGRWSSPLGGSGSAASPGLSWPWSSEPDPCLPGLSRSQRLLGSGAFALLSALCFGLAALYAPLLLLRARKFALLWTLGSLFALLAAAVLRGPTRLVAAPTPGGALYLSAMAGTLYAALGLHSTLLTALGAALQVAVIAWSAVALLPGGSAGMRLVGGLAAAAVRRTVAGKAMPV